MATLLPPGKLQFCDSDGKPLAGATIDFFVPGTSDRKDTWQDSAATILNTNPVVLDSAGEAVLFGQGIYRQVLTDAAGNLIWDQETSDGTSSTGNITVTGNITASGDVSIGGDLGAGTITVPGTATLGAATFSGDGFYSGPTGSITISANNFNMFTGWMVAGAADTSIFVTNLTSVNSNHAWFGYLGTNVGSITSRDGATTSYNTTSDYRLKTTFGLYAPESLIDTVPVYDGAFNAALSVRRPVFLAHELQARAPWAVQGEKDAVGKSGGIIPQQVDHSSLVPLLWAEMQKLRARVAALEAGKS